MTETTQFIGQIMGPVLLLMGISFMNKKDFYRKWFKELELSQPLLFVMGIVETSVGIAILLNHHLWGGITESLITIISYGMVLEGALTLTTNIKTLKYWVKNIMSTRMINFATIIYLIIGSYLTWTSYFL